jgi:signal transduction histidine kinase/CheY-like chemotaxis protein
MKKELKTIISGLVFILLLAAAVFALLSRYMGAQTEKDVSEIAHVHLDDISELESDRFNTIVHLRFRQIDELLRELARHGAFSEHEKAVDVLRRFAEFQAVENCTLVSASGELETVFGEPVKRLGDEAFLYENLHAGRRIVTDAWTESMHVSVYASPVRLPMASGRTSVGMLWCKSIALFKDMLYINREGGRVKYRLIRRDSSYVIDAGVPGDRNYFEHLRKHEAPDGSSPENLVAMFRQAVSSNEVFTLNSRHIDPELGIGESHCMRAVPLKESNWYLVSVAPYDVFDDVIEDMSLSRFRATIVAVVCMGAGVFAVFLIYMFMTMRQIADLEGAKLATEHALQDSQAAVAKEEAANAKALAAQKEAEAAKDRAEQASRAKSEFLSSMSHDIRTPMNAIVGLTSIARAHMDDSARVDDCLKKITASSRQLLGLINDILDMSKIESGKLSLKPETLSLRETLETLCDIVRPQIAGNGQNFDVFVFSMLSEQVVCDGVHLSQVLLNFLSNAMKYTPAGGSIELELWQEPSGKGPDWTDTHFVVRDTGMGMTEEFQKKLFMAFEREDSRRVQRIQGTGLGLAIAKHIVDAMEGTIEVQSAPGNGTSFHLRLDLERVHGSSDDLKLPPWTVLVVDDSRDLCRSVEASLAEMGARPQTCTSGEAAVDLAAKAHAAGEDFFAAIIDYRMPDMNGVQTAVKIREATGGKVPELLVSAYDWSDIEEDAKEADIAGFIPKPLFKSTLHRALTRLAGDGSCAGRGAEEAHPSLKGMHVLLAEDQPINADIATAILEDAGCTVAWAEDGVVARKLFAESDPGHFEAILMDLRMPHMGGLEATKAIRAMNRADAGTVPIIALTADAFAEDAQRCRSAGMNAHMTKPLDAKELTRLLVSLHEERKGTM